MSEQSYTIENVGGIASAVLTLRAGVNILRGVNGSGKTSAYRAVCRAHGRPLELEVRDGAKRGAVRGPGVSLTVGKVVRKTGHAELALADDGPLAELITGGAYKDEAARARAYLRAVTELLRLSVDDDAVATLCGDDEIAADWLREALRDGTVQELDETEVKLRGHLHARARDAEAAADEQAGEAEAARRRREEALQAVGGADALVTLDVESARAAVVEGAKAYQRAETACEGREALERQQAEIRASMGERPDPGKARAARDARHEVWQETDAECRRLERELAAARERRTARWEEYGAADRRLDEVEAEARRWDEAQKILMREPEGPVRDELPALEQQHVREPELQLERARHSAVYRTAEQEREHAEARRTQALSEAESLRAHARSLAHKIGEILARSGAEDLTVVAGRLHALVDGEQVDWERRLSEGQRVRRALDVAARVYQGVVPLSPGFWASLDPENRAHLADLAAERGLCVLTEEPSEGPLHIDHMGEELS